MIHALNIPDLSYMLYREFQTRMLKNKKHLYIPAHLDWLQSLKHFFINVS